jgi:RNA polymerase sigma-70 factor (ECF subfamily)
MSDPSQQRDPTGHGSDGLRQSGGGADGFQITRWTEILRARTDHAGRRREVVGEVLAKYWRPVYCYLRRKGRQDAEAMDLTQGFFHEVVLGRGLIQQADPMIGKFRTFLLTALNRYVTSVHRAETAQKRRPAEGMVHLDGFESAGAFEPASYGTPDDAFHYAWAQHLLDEVLAEVRGDCCRNGHEAHWAVFQARVLGPIMAGAEPLPLPDLCARHGIADEATASNMVVTVKRAFQAALRRRVREFVDSDDQVEGEIRDMMDALSSSRAGP